MCGIISYIGKSDALQVLIKGLKCLEYRGYDSAGIVIGDETHPFTIVKSVGRVELLAQKVAKIAIHGCVGIGHTRWATHGGVSEKNAHPHVSCDGRFILVHNGVIENSIGLKALLKEKGFTFYSDTDSEVLANLMAYHYGRLRELPTSQRFAESVRISLCEIQGTYGIAVICKDCPQELIGARKSSPLILGIHPDGFYLASDASAFAGQTKDVVFLSDNEMVHIHDHIYQVQDLSNGLINPTVETIDWDMNASDLGNYSHFMQKEIFEQDVALRNTILGRFSKDGSSAHLGGLQMTPQELRQIDRILLLGCGTASYACKVGEYLIEKYARIPVEVECASEFRYSNAPLDKNTLVFVISQSGETLDTLGALHEARRKGFKSLAITNVVGSTVARESDGGVYQRSGPEIGVASTKAFTGQICVLAMIALYLGRMRDMSFSDGCEFVRALQALPDCVQKTLQGCESTMQTIAHKYASYKDFFFLGRQILYPIAMEGALKLKEVSYVHAEAYPSGELKHGPLALIDENVPTFVLASDSSMLQKNISSMMEIRARNGKVIAVATEGAHVPEKAYNDIVYIPSVYEAVLPIVTTLPLQLFAYYMALERNCDVDKPRNLAKSVTVE